MAEQEYHIQLTLPDSGLVLQALAERPFKSVFELIGKLNHQAQQFYHPPVANGTAVAFSLTASEFALCVKALGDLPYNQVHQLLANLHEQLIAQKPAGAN